MAVKQTAGRNSLGDLAPKFAELNDDVLFGEVWSREDKLSLRDRCIVTVTALMAKGITDNSIKYHIENAKNHGVTRQKWWRSSLTLHFMLAGLTLGLSFQW